MPEWRIHRPYGRIDWQAATLRWAVGRACETFGVAAIGYALVGDWRSASVCLDATIDILLIGAVARYAMASLDLWKRRAILRILGGEGT